jgi:class 3 adenylate cyclase
MAEQQEDYRLAAIMFTDIYSFSRMMESNERKMLALLAEHNAIIQGLVLQFGGHVIKTIGDAFLVDFNNTVRATECAVEIQKAFHKFNENREKEEKIFLRIGVHLGDIWFFENDALGEGINIASRLQGLAKPGRIVISHDVYNQVYNKLDIEIFSLGKAKLKNITKEITAYEIPTEASAEFSEYHPEVMDFHDEKSSIEAPAEAEIAPGNPSPPHQTPPPPVQNAAETVNLSVQNVLPVENNPTEAELLAKLKSAGTRLPVEKIASFFGHSSRDFLEHALSRLADEGIVTRIDSPTGEVQFGMGDFRFESNRKGKKTIRDLILRRIARLRGDMMKIVPSILFTIILWWAFSWIQNRFTPGVNWVAPLMVALLCSLAGNFLVTVVAGRQISELRRVPRDVTEEQWSLLRRAQRAERGFLSHVRTWLAFSGIFYLVNMLTSAEFLKTVATSKTLGFLVKHPVFLMITKNEHYHDLITRFPDWWQIAAGAWGIALLFHFLSSAGYAARLRSELRAMGYRRVSRHDARLEFAGVEDDDD